MFAQLIVLRESIEWIQRGVRQSWCLHGNYDSGNICGLYDDGRFHSEYVFDCGGGFQKRARSTKNVSPLRITMTREMDS